MTNGWDFKVADHGKSLFLYVLKFMPKIGSVVKYSIVVDHRKKVSAVVAGKIISLSACDWISGSTLKSWGDLTRLISFVEQEVNFNETPEKNVDELISKCIKNLETIQFDDNKKQRKKEIIEDQLKNLNMPSNHWRFKISSLLASFHLRNISTTRYAVMMSMFSLPSIRKLRTMSAGFNVMDNAHYFTELIKKVSPLQKVVAISIDEVYLSESSDHKSGKLHGFAEVY